MNRIHNSTEPRMANVAVGVKALAAVFVIGLLLVVAEARRDPESVAGPAQEASTAAATVRQPADYFPAGYELHATETEEHVQAF
jgi:hypothetical protein